MEFREFDGAYGYGHSWICIAMDLPDIVKQFVKGCQDGKKRSEN